MLCPFRIRKWCGGGAKGGGEGGGTGGTSRSSPVTTPGGSKSATSYGAGGGTPAIIPSGQLFAGRSEGGGTRGQIFGTRTFGSGYPTNSGRGVLGKPFPFVFWPLSFGAGAGIGTGAYLHSNSEYGHSDNSSRPGGVMTTANFQSNGPNGTVFRILADLMTVTDLIEDIVANCSGSLSNSSISAGGSPSSYNDSSTLPPQPEQIVQYYRASSIALSLDGYNNTSIFMAEGTPDVPLPSGIDATALDCLNQTIGAAAPLIGGVGRQWAAIPNNMGLMSLVWLVWLSSRFM
ncbi:hypothetical protein B0H14DRAFT_2739233 [Mycena olivaceomarginata]|nr:hypothetical protein B0H14DRAFT_2739233 [Mycena olivaceomarginata]